MKENYSQEYLADVLGVSQKTYSNMENGKSEISFDTVIKLIEFYNIDVSNIDIETFLKEGKLVEVKENTFKDQSAGVIINQITDKDKLIAQYEERIAELKSQLIDKERVIKGLL